MTFHRLMIGTALLLAAIGMRIYLPAETQPAIAAVQQLIGEDEYALPEEAVAWIPWR